MEELQEAFEWAQKIIRSCWRPFHMESAVKICELFKARYGEIAEYHMLLEELMKKDTAITII